MYCISDIFIESLMLINSKSSASFACQAARYRKGAEELGTEHFHLTGFTGSRLSSDNDDIMWKKATYLYKLLLLSTVST